MNVSSIGRESIGSGVLPLSLHLPHLFSQYIVAFGFRPEVASLNNVRRTFTCASTGPRTSSWRKCFRSVAVERTPTSAAICSCLRPYPASARTLLRCSGLGSNLRGTGALVFIDHNQSATARARSRLRVVLLFALLWHQLRLAFIPKHAHLRVPAGRRHLIGSTRHGCAGLGEAVI